ncbi:MAG TPA: apolipoprotein N-acyltransferase [Reyranella sp.]|nr:apolipoprotein N-acyltransferase [Reyranella sp.]
MIKLQGWRALGVALVAGALAALAMPPLYWLPLAIVGIVAYVWLWQAAPTPLSAFWRGLAWGTGHFAIGSYWILEAFYVPPADFALLGPPIVAGLAVLLGFFPGLAAWASRRIVDRWPDLAGRYSRLVVLAIAWTVAEWLRGHLFTGYPWNPLGHVLGFATPLLQGAALFGVYGLGMLTFLVLAAPTAGWRASIAALLVVGLVGWAGQSAMAAIDSGNGPWIRIVQPNVPQAQKWRPETRTQQVTKLVQMSRQPGFDRLAAVVWPEMALPDLIAPRSATLAKIAQAVPPGGLLLTGAGRYVETPEDGVWNSLLVVDGTGAIAATYDKVHLVPLGEYIPFHKQLAPVSGMIGRGSFEVGEGRVTLVPTNGLPSFSPIICYEAIFPAAVTGPGERPQWLLNITNDAWFGLTSGPYQHLTSARLRTIEEGLPMIRAANTGVSAVIDAYGRVLKSLDMQQEGIIDHRLPAPRVATPYARWGDWTLLVMVAFLSVTLIGTRLWKSRQPQ